MIRSHPMSKITRLFSSVFVRLLLVCLAAWLLITVAVSTLFVGYRILAGLPYNPLIDHYFAYLVTDIAGQPERAGQIAARLGIEIDYQGPEHRWSTGGTPPPDRLRFFQTPDNDTLSFAFRHDVKYFRYQHPSGSYLFTLPEQHSDGWLQSHLHLLALIIIALTFAGAYFLIRRILAPISSLHEATRKVAKGDLNHRVDIAGTSELAKLADSFNDMVRQLREMISAKEQLLRDVSHELRSPLTRIKVLLELVEPPDRVDQIRRDIKELEDLVSAILESARQFHAVDSLRMEDIDLGDLVAEVVARQEEPAKNVVLEKPAHPISAGIDRRLFTRVVDNLLTNALLHGQPATAPIRIGLAQGNGYVELTITDSGPGIREQDLPHLMEPFYQADKSRSREKAGFGLGLSLCKTIVAAHGGELILTSRPGQGTTALVRLPGNTHIGENT